MDIEKPSEKKLGFHKRGGSKELKDIRDRIVSIK